MRRLLPILCLTLAVLLGSAGVSWSADLQKGLDAHRNKDYATALRELKPLAEQGDAYAQNNLGSMYESGHGVPQDNKTAVKWYRLAAEQGYTPAQVSANTLRNNLEKPQQKIAEQKPSPTVTAEKPSASSSGDFQKGMTAYDKGDYATALREWKPLAEQGDAGVQYNLGAMYDEGLGVPQDQKTAVKWFRLAAEQGFAGAQYKLGVRYAKGRGVPQNDKTAVKWFRLAAEQGIALAQYNLGTMYHRGKGVLQNQKTAVKWYKLAADQGLSYAQNNLGNMHRDGKGVPQNDKTATKWYGLADEQGNAFAKQRTVELEKLISQSSTKEESSAPEKRQYCLLGSEHSHYAIRGNCSSKYEKGADGKGGYLIALHEWKLFAEEGNGYAYYNLGQIYRRGQGVPKDYKTAVKWYRRAAEYEVAGAQNSLGRMYNNGQGVKQDLKTALKWFRLAAEQGNADAQNNLGLMYNSGKRQFLKSDGGKSNQTQDEGIPQNYKIAVKWFRLAAEQGHVRAQLTLGVMYENGQGVPQNDEAAAKWYRFAAEQGNAYAQNNLKKLLKPWWKFW